MAFRPALELLNFLESLESKRWQGTAWRHMFAENPPSRPNDQGARWNPKGIPAIYCSLDRSISLAEAEYAIAAQPLRPKAKRILYRLSVELMSVVDLSDRQTLEQIGIGERELRSIDHSSCQEVGGAVEWLQHDGLLIPSARAVGTNLVIFRVG